jgi:hypothetical protein
MASSKEKETYTEEFRNQVRIIKILIDIGTGVLKECFPILANKAFANKLYKDKRALFDKILKDPRVDLFDEQRKKLQTGDISKFDITLFFVIYKHFLKRDSKEFEYVKKIKDIRNECFGHIYHVGSGSSALQMLNENEEPPAKSNFPNKDFVVKNLTYSFIGLIKITHSDFNQKIIELREKIRKCKEDRLDSISVESYREKITNLIAQDRETSELILREISCLNIPAIKELIEKGNKYNKKNFEEVKQQLKNIFVKLQKETDYNLVDLMKSISDRLENVHQNVIENGKKIEMARAELMEASNENRELIISEIQESKNVIIDEIRNLPSTLSSRKYNHLVSINLHDYDAYFRNEEEEISRYFKILILDSSDYNKDEIRLDSFLPVLANFDWNIIIDMNNNESFSSFICKNSRKNFMIKDFHELDKTINDIELIFGGEKLCYIKSDNQDNHEIDEVYLIKEFFNKIEFKRCVSEFEFLVSNFLLGENYNQDRIEKLDDIYKDFKDSIYKHNKTKKLELVNVIFDDLKNIGEQIIDFLDKKIDKKNIVKRILKTSFNSFTTHFTPANLKTEGDVFLPGKDSDITWTLEDEKNYGTFIEVYHKQIGNLDNHDENEINQIYFNKKLSFLKGKEIDPVTIYLNDVLKKPTYHQMKIIKELDEKIKDKSQRKVFFENNPMVIDITHEPASGGTTVGRVLLFKNREKLPCMRIKNMEHHNYLIEILTKISKDSKLPLIILIDSSDLRSINRNDVENLSNHLRSNLRLKHLILFVHRSNPIQSDPKLKITQRLDDSEIREYEKLYKEFLSERKFNEEQMLFYKSLITFKLTHLRLYTESENEKMKDVLDELVREFCRDLDEQGKKLIMLTYFNDKFSMSAYFNKNLTGLLLNTTLKEMSEFYENKINDSTRFMPLKYLKYKVNQGFKPLDNNLFEQMIGYVYPEGNHFEKFVEIFKTFIVSVGAGDEDLIDMARSLLTNYKFGNEKKNRKIPIKEREEDSDEDDLEMLTDDSTSSISDVENNPEKTFYSPFVNECTNKLGRNKTEEKLGEFYDLFKDEKESIYLGSLWARYKFHDKAKTYEEKTSAVDIFRKVLGIKERFDSKKIPYNAKKSDLLCSYGDILRHYAKIKDHQSRDYDEIIKTSEEAIDVYEESQRLDEDNEVPLIGECKLRYMVLFYHFRKNCRGSPAEYLKKLDSSPKIITDSEKNLVIKFDKLERIIYHKELKWNDSLNKIYYECKIQVLTLRMQVVTVNNLMKLPDTYQIGLSNLMNLNKKPSQSSFEIKDYFSVDFNVDHLIELIKRYEKQAKTSTELLSSSFRDWLSSIIILANKKHNYINSNWDISKAIELSELWKKRYHTEAEPYFFLGTFHFIQALDTNNPESFQKAKEYFTICRQKYKRMSPAPKKFRWPVFVVGKESGLFSLLNFYLIKHDEENPENNYKKFESQLVRDHQYKDRLIVNFNGLKVRYLERNALNPDNRLKEHEKDQKINFKFYILIRRCDLCMYKFSRSNA